MSDLGDYFSQQSEIEQLKAEVALLRKKTKNFSGGNVQT